MWDENYGMVASNQSRLVEHIERPLLIGKHCSGRRDQVHDRVDVLLYVGMILARLFVPVTRLRRRLGLMAIGMLSIAAVSLAAVLVGGVRDAAGGGVTTGGVTRGHLFR